MKINIGLSEPQRRGTVKVLTRVLADQHVLYIKTRGFHWNVTGPQFNDLHQFLETQYEQIEAAIDEVAERIRMLGFTSPASLAEFLESATLKEHVGKPPTAQKMLAILTADHEAVIRALREGAEECAESHGDAGTNDFLIGLMQQHEKTAWMLRAHAG